MIFILFDFVKIKSIYNIRKYKKKIIAVILIIILIPSVTKNLPQDNLKIYFIDVGQGDSCLLVTPNNKKILVDRRRT